MKSLQRKNNIKSTQHEKKHSLDDMPLISSLIDGGGIIKKEQKMFLILHLLALSSTFLFSEAAEVFM